MKSSPYGVYTEILAALETIGQMSRAELAQHFNVPKPTMSCWLHRMRKQGLSLAIVDWETTGGNRAPVYGRGLFDAGEPPVDELAMKRKWNNANRTMRALKNKTGRSELIRYNNLFGTSFQGAIQ